MPADLESCAALGAAMWMLSPGEAFSYLTALLYFGCAAMMAKGAFTSVRRVRAARRGTTRHATALADSARGGGAAAPCG
ncbi:hypothetical protein ACFV0R_09030 [Streptomyces sp. NPDC059578]|uniref:hypothetical protein n=1 Tax=unclassified Streptomyces TaxID=2593676 RepID=UPI00364EA2EB